ncbi:MAG: ATP-binding cassette domain-containing protein [Clostridiales bacterium]|nr:ATP-binding cassette domain-containing protein [Clostridiales bacterium]
MISVRNLCKSFKSKDGEVSALTEVSLAVEKGVALGVIGFSGAGKSTLVRCLNGLEKPSSGTVTVCGRIVNDLKGKQLLSLRRKVGMIFQSFNLFEQKTAIANVMFPLSAAGVKRAQARERAESLLTEVGLADKFNAYPSQLSGGQKQRVAIARALALNPEVLLCDEATSALDPETAVQTVNLLKRINAKYGLTLVVISHQIEVIKSISDSVVVLNGGQVVESGKTDEVFGKPQSAATKRILVLEGGINE